MKLTAMILRVKRPMNGSNILKIEELQWMTMSKLADPQFQDLKL
jgi:hypothetical protein